MSKQTIYTNTVRETRKVIKMATFVDVRCHTSLDDTLDIETTKAAALRSIEDYPGEAAFCASLYFYEDGRSCCTIGGGW